VAVIATTVVTGEIVLVAARAIGTAASSAGAATSEVVASNIS